MSTAAQAMALAAQAFSAASAELEKLCNFARPVENPNVEVSLGTQTDEPQPGPNIGSPGGRDAPEGSWNKGRGSASNSDYYLSDEDNDEYINALLKRQKSPEPNLEAKREANAMIPPASHPSPPSVPAQPQKQTPLLSSGPQPSYTSHAIDAPGSVEGFERHLLVDLETDLIPTVCALTQRFPKVVCYMQCALPSIMVYHRIIKHITESTVNKQASIPRESSVAEGVRPTGKSTVIDASDPKKSDSEGKLDPDRGRTVVPGSSTTELLLDGKPVQSAAGTNPTHQIGSDDDNKTKPTSEQAPTKIREYFVVPDDFHLIPAICMLAKEKSCKNVICYVQIVGVIQTLINQIHSLTSKPIFIIASPNSAALPGALKAFDSPTGGIVFCNYLHPLCQPLHTESIHRIIHAGWIGKLALYSQQINTAGNAQKCIIMTQSQHSAIPDPDAIFGTSGLNISRSLLDPARFDTMVAQWESQLNHAPEKALNRCYMEWISYHGHGPSKIASWSTIELVSHANLFGENVLRRKGGSGALAASEGL
ncbi:hypothetical protein FRC11_004907, partial [Ceratobasidium sp. 423]